MNKFTIREQATRLVARLLEQEIVRVCGFCEREFGRVKVAPGQLKSHGFCRRHAVDAVEGMPEPERTEILDDMYAKGDFCPDLAEHPEMRSQEATGTLPQTPQHAQ